MKTHISNRFHHNVLKGGLCFMLLSCFGITAMAQADSASTAPRRIVKKAKPVPTREVTGIVKDASTGLPMGGVRVQALGNERFSALTEEDGTFKVNVPTYTTSLYIYAPDYNIQHATIHDDKVEAELISSAFAPFYDDAEVITSQRTMNLDETSSLTVETDMGYRLAGDINITSKNGLPGQGAYMTIRGINSLNADAQPLVIIDGNIVDMQYDRTALHEGYYNNVLSGLDPENVDKIQVLKNGTALYGAKGANGVIIITTKRGRSMATKINVRIYDGFETVPNQLSVMNGGQYTSYISDLVSTIKDESGNKLSSYTFLNQSASNYYRKIFNNNTDWQKDMYRTAVTQNYKINVQGGDDVGMYSLSLGYSDAQSTGKGTDFSRLNLRFNTDIKIGNKITTGLDVAYNQTSYNILDNGWSDNYDMQNIGSPNVLGVISAPFLSPYSYYMDENTGQLALSDSYAGKYASTSTDWIANPFRFPRTVGINESLRNPYWVLENTEGKNKNYAELTQISLNVSPKYQVTKTFAISDRFNYSLNRNNEKYFLPIAGATPYTLTDLGDITSVLKSQFTKESTINNDLRLEWKNTYGAHDIDVFGGWRVNNYSYSYTYMRGYNNENDKLPNINKNMQFLNYDGVNDNWIDMTYYLQAAYNYAHRYYAELTMSAEASSRFGKNTKSGFQAAGVSWGFFPSIQLGWVISNEKWFKAGSRVNFLKLTAGFEQNGNDNLDYYAARTYWESQRVTENTVGLYLKNIANSSIQWETVTKWNVALEGSFLKNRLQARLDLYWNKTSDLLALRDLSDKYYYSGMRQYWTNEGELTNKGFEASVTAAIINKKDWKWEAGLTVGHYNNCVTELPDSKDNTIEYYTRDADGNQASTPYKTIKGYTRSAYGESNILTAVGYAAGTFYGWQVDRNITNGTGVFSSEAEASNATSAFGGKSKLRYYTGVAGSYREFSAGDMAFVDQNGDGWIDESDKVAIGNANPDIFGNIFTSLSWKWLRLDANFKYSLGNDIYNYQRSMIESGTTTYNQSTAMVRRWTTEGQVTDMPRVCYTDNDNYVGNDRMSDRWIEDGSYLKLTNLRLTYTCPYHNSWLQGLKVWGECNNVFTITKYLGLDPETSACNSLLYQGIDAGRITSGRSFMFGVSLNL